MISQQEMAFQLAALQRQRDSALYQVVIAEARIAMLETEIAQLRSPTPVSEELGEILKFRDRQSMTEP